MSQHTCSIDGCGGPVVARSYCRKHYLRWYRNGAPEIDNRRPVTHCSVEGCERRVSGRGWCKMHYLRWYRHGDPEYVPKARERGPCSVNGCEAVERSRGLCALHYDRWLRSGDTAAPKPPPVVPAADRFWAMVDKSGDCWEWTGGCFATGYGAFSFDGHPILAHRYSFQLSNGYFPPEVDHQCHNRRCVNPDHLRPADRKLNMENFIGLSARNKTGFRGVHEHRGRFIAKVGHYGAVYHVGSFETAAEAGEAARLKRLELHKYNDRDRIA